MEGRVLVGLDAINLIESGLGELCCRTVAVLAPGEQRVQRIMQRDHIPEEYARLRIQAQKPDSYYREHCTDVLENQGGDAGGVPGEGGDFFPGSAAAAPPYHRRRT